MSVSISGVFKKAAVPGSERMSVTDVTLDNSYQEGGEPLTPAQFGLRKVTFAICTVRNGSEAEATAVGSAWYGQVNNLLHVNDYKTQKEMAGGKDLSKVVIRVIAFGS